MPLLHWIWALVSITIPRHRHGAQTCSFLAFLALKAKGWGRRDLPCPMPLPMHFITMSGVKKGSFDSLQVIPSVLRGACAPQGSVTLPRLRGKGGSARGGAELICFGGAAFLFLGFSAPIHRAEQAALGR